MGPPGQFTGQVLGHYRVIERIGGGGMGVVFRVHDERLDRDVALKVLPVGALSDESARKRFWKEALAVSRLNHPNIETVYDFDTQDGTDFLIMELVAGDTLDKKLSGAPLPEKDTLALGVQIAKAMEDAHDHGILHRDLKPANLMVTPKGQVKVLDFGLAKLLRISVTALTESLDATPGVVGTLPYMAPEQLRGEPPDFRSDLYALGVVLYEMATGHRPFPQLQPSKLPQTHCSLIDLVALSACETEVRICGTLTRSSNAYRLATRRSSTASMGRVSHYCWYTPGVLRTGLCPWRRARR